MRLPQEPDRGPSKMGSTRTRITKAENVRYQALYFDLQGKLRSAGTFSREKDAESAWRNAEAKIRTGQPWDPQRGKQKFRYYVEEKWLPNHVMEPSTRQDYTSAIYKHIIPALHDRGCSCGLKPPVSSSDLAM